jgi:predicted ribosomally synthesized peptide with SipW-like signal peptide
MKKTIISLSIIGIVAAIAIGATVAYFNDTETSAGNILVAGTMDLKVDHLYASYNGNPCTENCVPDTSIDLMSSRNGGFEQPVVTDPAKWDIFPDGTSGLNWTVEWRSDIPASLPGGYTRPDPALQELHRGVLGSAAEGDQYAELDTDWDGPGGGLNNEPASVKIYQDISTTPGQKYQLKFAFTPRAGRPAADNHLEVKWNGAVVATIGPIAGSMNWQIYTYDVTASGNTSRLEFTDLGTANSFGTFLDAVKLHPYECEYTIIGGTCTLWDLKDLGEGDYYWDFDDVKPGDYGLNIISFHSYDNDAYACLITHDIVDVENTVVDPEIEAGDDIASIIGELSQFITLFAWEDTNQNNAYDNGEPIISGPDQPLDTAIGEISLTESNTKYIGVAWCAGTQSVVDSTISCDGSSMGDIAQSDIMTASITAYIEQQRNNPDFDCSNVILP